MNKKRLVNKIKIALSVVIVVSITCGFTVTASDGETNLNKEYISYINKVCNQKNICPEYVEAIIEHESAGKSQIVSSAGCVGLMQMSPRNDFSQGRNPYDWKQNIDAGTDYLLYLFEKFDGDPGVVLVAYNTGEYSRSTKNALNNGQLNGYAKRILDRSECLERLHDK